MYSQLHKHMEMNVGTSLNGIEGLDRYVAYHVGTKLCAWQTYQPAVFQATFKLELERE